MPSNYFDPGTARSEKVHALFSRIASRYDLINDLQSFGLHRYWKRKLIQLAKIKRGEALLDVCTGTGDIAFAAYEAGANVIGFDFTEAMLVQALARRRHDGPEFMRGDALNLPFANSSFDLVTISYGLRNLRDIDRALQEMLRILRPGGRLLILDFGKPENQLWRFCYFAYLRLIVPLFGLCFAGDAAAYSYILDSLHAYPGQIAVDRRLRDLGCPATRIHSFLGGVMTINYAESPGGAPKTIENARAAQ